MAEVAQRVPPSWSVEQEERLEERVDFRHKPGPQPFTIDKRSTRDIGQPAPTPPPR
jgi:exoribonuclease R